MASQILGNPKYMGRYYAFERIYTRHGDKYRQTLKPEQDRILMPEGTCPPIVDEDTWHVVQAQLDYNKANASRNARYPEMALCRGKIARCAYCGGAMNCRNDNRRGLYTQYFCIKGATKKGCPDRNTIHGKILDDAVWKRCCEIIRDPSKLKESIEALRTPNPVASEEKPIEVRKKELEDEIAEYVDLMHTAKSDAAKKRAKGWIKILEDELEEIERKEKILDAIKQNWQKAEDQIKIFEQWCIGMRENLDTATFAQKRTCIQYLGIRVRVWKFGTRPRLVTEVSPPSIVEALSGVKKNDHLTLYSQSHSDPAQSHSRLHRRAAQQPGRTQ